MSSPVAAHAAGPHRGGGFRARVGAMARRLVVAVAIGALLAVVAGGAIGGMAALALDGLTRSMAYRNGYADPDLLVILAIGSDKGPPHRPDDPLRGLADGIHLLVADTRANRMTVVDIPRDSFIGGTKVNAHLGSGGPERLEAQLEAWTGLPIDYWVLGSFWSLERVAEGMRGLEVEVTQPMVDPYSGSNLQPGFQRLDPGQALAFTRNRRSLSNGDIGRTHNQGRLLISVLQQMRNEAQSLQDVLGLVQLFQRTTASNIPPQQVLPLALTALRIEPTAVEQVTVSGPTGFVGTQSVVRPQPGDLFPRLAAGQVGPRPGG